MERRRVYIYLPDEYYEKPKRQYPVLYMFDGHNVFYDEDATYGKSWGMEQYLQKSGRKLMVVALESSRAPDYGRLKEYAPFSFTTEETGWNYRQRGYHYGLDCPCSQADSRYPVPHQGRPQAYLSGRLLYGRTYDTLWASGVSGGLFARRGTFAFTLD